MNGLRQGGIWTLKPRVALSFIGHELPGHRLKPQLVTHQKLLHSSLPYLADRFTGAEIRGSLLPGPGAVPQGNHGGFHGQAFRAARSVYN
jgi:hypothetical protein